MKKFVRNEDLGITLIALVITIIVLLILAGISISMLSGNNSILQKATDAKTKTERTTVIESAQVDILGKQAENKGNDLEKNQLQAILSTYFQNVPDMSEMDTENILNTELTTLSQYGTYKIKVSELFNGNLKETEKIRTALDLREGEIVRYNSSAGNIDCMVLYDSTEEDFENLGVQIISLDTVGDEIEIGNGTGSSSQTNDATLFNIALESYVSALSSLNEKAENYLKKDSTDVAKDARCVGSNPIAKTSTNTTRTVSGVTLYNSDDNYTYDFTQMQKDNISIYNIGKEYWMASYYMEKTAQGSLHWGYVRFASEDEIKIHSPLYIDTNWGHKYSYSWTSNFRPVFILKQDAKIMDGIGTAESPYILEL